MYAEEDSGLVDSSEFKDGHKCSFEQSTGIKLHDAASRMLSAEFSFRSYVFVSIIKNLQESEGPIAVHCKVRRITCKHALAVSRFQFKLIVVVHSSVS